MKEPSIKQRRFTIDDQMAFAKLSGDYNPLHINPVAARRFIFGRPVVHGIHAFLWALDEWMEGYTTSLDLCTVEVTFQSAIGVGETVNCSIRRSDENSVEIELTTEVARIARISVSWSHSKPQRQRSFLTGPSEPPNCRILSTGEIPTTSGSFDLYFDLNSSTDLFPNLIRVLPPIQLSVILSTTRLVGMECPGLNSIYSGLNLVFSTETEGPLELAYDVVRYDERFSLLSMKVDAPGVNGDIKAFVRPVPREQANYNDMSELVNDGEFAGQRAFIIGGSRGLGEVTAKLLASGGAEVKITYHRGSRDAQRVIEEIVSGGGTADCLPFNVLEQPQNLADHFGKQWTPTCLYYFATPFIFMATKGAFSSRLFQKFCDFYVTGFLNTVQTLHCLGFNIQKIFYPSTVAIEELPLDMGEYSAAKVAGETLCTFIGKTIPNIIIHKPRLPRIATDQTATLLSIDDQDPARLMLKNLRSLRDA